MKRTLGFVLAAGVALLPLAGCKFIGHPDYQLAVTVEAGVSGSPANGVYTHKELEEVAYNYVAEDSRNTVEVLVDEETEAAAASVIIYHDTALVARLFDPRGPWEITALDANSAETKFTVLLEGAGLLQGTFRDDRGHFGTWLANAGSLALVFSDLAGHKFITPIPAISGTWTWDNGTNQGTWTAVRIPYENFRWK